MKIILVGKAASGKDHLKNRLRERGFKAGISHTTRKPRNGEVDGVDYHFISEFEFIEMVGNDKFIEHMDFNGGFYGQTKEDFDNADVMIMSKDGLDILPKEYRDQAMVIYLDIDRKSRIERLNNRNDTNDTLLRRLDADDLQFEKFEDFDFRVTNNNF
jgi:guanylate kinase